MQKFYKPDQSKFNFDLSKFKNIKINLPSFITGKGIMKVLGVLLAVLLVLGGIGGVVYGVPAYKIYKAGKDLRGSTYQLKQAMKTEDLNKIEDGLRGFEKDYEEFRIVYNNNSGRLKTLPFVNRYVKDMDRFLNASEKGIELGYLVLETLDPYAEELGLVEGSSELTNEERITQITKVLPQFANEVDEISRLLVEIDNELQQVDATKYPKDFRGMKIREQVVSIKTVSSELAKKSPEFKGLFEELPTLLGVTEPQTYLVLMANSTELRMSGGFTTYAVVLEVENGVPEIVKSIDTYNIDKDSYELDNRNVPPYMEKYLKVNRLYARDALSTSPDFVDGSDLFIDRYWNVHRQVYPGQLPEVDGVVQVNTHLAENLLEVLGPVEVEGRSFLTDQGTYKGFSDTEFNANNVIYNLEVIANSKLSEIQGRKDVINFLLESILDKLLHAKTENLASIARVALEGLGSKDVMVYSFDEGAQNAIESLGYGGRVHNRPTKEWDYLYVVHSNFGAGKRDWIVERETTKTVYEENGRKMSKVSILVKNPKAPEWWQSDWQYTYRDYLRLYVPEGSNLVSAEASHGQDIEEKKMDGDEPNKDYFQMFFTLEEGKNVTIDVVYELPNTVDLEDYKILLQKQSGTHGDLYRLIKGDTEKRFTLNSDMKIDFDSFGEAAAADSIEAAID